MTSETSTAETAKTPDALAARLFEQSVAMLDVMSVYVGDQLGLYRSLHDGGPATAPELASRAGIDARYAREWLEQQAATGILDVDDVAAAANKRRYLLPEAHVEPLVNLESPYSITPLTRTMVACGRVMPQLMEAYRTGGGVEWSEYGPDMIEAQGDFNRPWLVNSFGSEMLPAMPAIHERLTSDPPARVADVACGVGWAAISLARAYPKLTVDGFDLDDSSIELARENGRRSGVSDRVTFERRDAADPSAAGQYDLVVIIEAVHDLSGPIEVLSAVRRMLRPGGVVLIADEKTEDAFTAPAGEIERMLYGLSLFTCLPSAMTERPTAATGTVIREETMRRFASEAGFGSFERLDQPELDMLRFYRLSDPSATT